MVTHQEGRACASDGAMLSVHVGRALAISMGHGGAVASLAVAMMVLNSAGTLNEHTGQCGPRSGMSASISLIGIGPIQVGDVAVACSIPFEPRGTGRLTSAS